MITLCNFLLIIVSFIFFHYIYIFIGNKLNISKIISKKINSKNKKIMSLVAGITILAIFQTVIVNIFSISGFLSIIIVSAEISLLNYLVLYSTNKNK